MKFWRSYFAILTVLPYNLLTAEEIQHETIFSKDWGMIASVVTIKSKSDFNYALIDIPKRKAKDNIAKHWSDEKHVLMVNGGYFKHDFSPLGYYKVNGQLVNKNINPKLTGFLAIDNQGKLAILDQQELESNPEKSDYQSLIQAGPYLIDPGGKIGIHHNNYKRRQRTVISKTFDGDTQIINTAPITLYHLSRAIKQHFPQIERALNLDGGTSSALMTSQIKLFNRVPVRNYIVVSKPQ